MDISKMIGEKQTYENMDVIPIIGDKNNQQDLLDLKTAIEMGLVEVKECVPETVGTIIIVNNAVTPLLLIDGEQVEGAKQNRIINQTIIIPPKTEMKIPVSCTEQGRWNYNGNLKTKNFKHSNYFANADTRASKRLSKDSLRSTQQVVWDSVRDLQMVCCTSSETSALQDTYNSSKINNEEYLKNFKLVDNQIGVIIFINNQFKGVEIINNIDLFSKYYVMILNSYIIDAISKKDKEYGAPDNLDDILEDIFNMDLKETNSIGLEKNFDANSKEILGSLSNYEDNLLHATYFKVDKKLDDEVDKKFGDEVYNIIY